jgi:hypothetical protein
VTNEEILERTIIERDEAVAECARAAQLLTWLTLARDEGFQVLAQYLSGPQDYSMFYDTCDVDAATFARIWANNLNEAIADYEAGRD